MNYTFFETRKNEKFITRHVGKEFTTLFIDIKKVTFAGKPWRSLGAYGKRKFENLLVFETPNERLKFVYG